MPTYTEVLPAQIAPESYIDSNLTGQWTNNVLAIADNDPSAPNIVNLTDESNVAPTSGADYIFVAALGDGNIFLNVGFLLVPGMYFVVDRSGDYLIDYQMRTTNSQGNAQGRLYVNQQSTAYSGPVAIGSTFSEGDGNWQTSVQSNIALAAGDIVYLYGNANSSQGAFYRNLYLRSATKLFG